MPQKIRIIGVPMDLGASRRGVDMGPSALRVAGLQARIKQLGHQVEDIGNISVKQPEEMPYGEKRAKYIEEIADACKDLGTAVQKSLEDGYMPLSALMGYGTEELYDLFGYKPKIEPQNVALVGVRDLDSHEKKFIKKLGVKAFTMREIDERGMREVMSDALKYAMDDTDGVVVSLDMDFVDPSDAPGVGTPVRGGVTYREAHLAMEMIADSETMASMEIVEINPVIDEHNRTALLGVELVLSGLGKKIL